MLVISKEMEVQMVKLYCNLISVNYLTVLVTIMNSMHINKFKYTGNLSVVDANLGNLVLADYLVVQKTSLIGKLK